MVDHDPEKHKDIVKYADYMYFPVDDETAVLRHDYWNINSYKSGLFRCFRYSLRGLWISGLNSAGRTDKILQCLISKSFSLLRKTTGIAGRTDIISNVSRDRMSISKSAIRTSSEPATDLFLFMQSRCTPIISSTDLDSLRERRLQKTYITAFASLKITPVPAHIRLTEEHTPQRQSCFTIPDLSYIRNSIHHRTAAASTVL